MSPGVLNHTYSGIQVTRQLGAEGVAAFSTSGPSNQHLLQPAPGQETFESADSDDDDMPALEGADASESGQSGLEDNSGRGRGGRGVRKNGGARGRGGRGKKNNKRPAPPPAQPAANQPAEPDASEVNGGEEGEKLPPTPLNINDIRERPKPKKKVSKEQALAIKKGKTAANHAQALLTLFMNKPDKPIKD